MYLNFAILLHMYTAPGYKQQRANVIWFSKRYCNYFSPANPRSTEKSYSAEIQIPNTYLKQMEDG